MVVQYRAMNSGKKIIETSDQKICADIRMLTENLLQAYADCMTITCPEERLSTMKILQHLKEDFEGYFDTYVDRRASKREKSTFIDMVHYYGITMDSELSELLAQN